jgi:hypothetical protein
MADGIPGPCWCTTMPPVVAVPADGITSCWCPACLKLHIETTTKSSPELPAAD